MSFWDMLKIGASGLHAQRLRLDVISNNIANAETTRTDEGGPYRRQDVVFMPQEDRSFAPHLVRARLGLASGEQTSVGGVNVVRITEDQSEGSLVFDPTHQDANEEGYVEYPNVNMVVEMTNMISASRSYEANLSIVEAAKRMALKALEIGR